MPTHKEINAFLKGLPIARHCWSIDDCNNALEDLGKFAYENEMQYSDYPKNMKTRYNSLSNKRRKIWNNSIN